ncbi:CAP domain-containing protein [Beijerinckia mobilis]|uniref:CAP domain-containing protein n=1 Tax=Beijerinckia mobilis TaxID=231434 RepID=UPI0009FEC8BF|nr:CAP domain-containing protein [Beijerinckia mobilis]
MKTIAREKRASCRDEATRPVAILVASAFAAALAGCALAPKTTQQAAHPPIAAKPLDVDPATAERLISSYRMAHGLTPVRLDPRLQAFARDQAEAMARADHLSHEIAAPLAARLAKINLAKATAVENVSAGYATTPAVFAGWCHSPGHDANLRDPAMRRMGIGAAEAPGTRYRTYWALVMTD